jgi:hypothetical protein
VQMHMAAAGSAGHWCARASRPACAMCSHEPRRAIDVSPICGTPYLVGARRRDDAPGGSLCKKEPRPWGQPHTSKEVADP